MNFGVRWAYLIGPPMRGATFAGVTGSINIPQSINPIDSHQQTMEINIYIKDLLYKFLILILLTKQVSVHIKVTSRKGMP